MREKKNQTAGVGFAARACSPFSDNTIVMFLIATLSSDEVAKPFAQGASYFNVTYESAFEIDNYSIFRSP